MARMARIGHLTKNQTPLWVQVPYVRFLSVCETDSGDCKPYGTRSLVAIHVLTNIKKKYLYSWKAHSCCTKFVRMCTTSHTCVVLFQFYDKWFKQINHTSLCCTIETNTRNTETNL